ncbi:hypothetical protein [Amycolatopsis sp.]|nr:hypothetical protein [Amycolatopsis sp.]HVV09264.1 hypothetical protein [Amycolatopsis sp.]
MQTAAEAREGGVSTYVRGLDLTDPSTAGGVIDQCARSAPPGT